MPTITANGVTFHYLQAGHGPDLVMLHGLSGNLATWHLRIVPLLQARFRITTYDLRGHGRSSMPASGYTTRDMADDLEALLDALDIADASLAGHSFGADIVLHFALLHPARVRKMVLIEPGIPALVRDREGADWPGWAYWAEDLQRLTGEPIPRERWNDLAFMVRRSVEIPVVYGPLKGLPRRKDRILKLLDTTTVIADYDVVGELTLDNLATIPHPKLLLYDGGSAWLTTFNVLRGLLVNCSPLVLPASDLRHFAPLDAPELLVEHLTRFLGVDSADAPGGVAVAPVAQDAGSFIRRF
jgi:pimeloyl-ACP methyl ester carboxylesterase